MPLPLHRPVLTGSRTDPLPGAFGLRYRGTQADSERADPAGRIDEPNQDCGAGRNDEESRNKGHVALSSISLGSHAPQPRSSAADPYRVLSQAVGSAHGQEPATSSPPEMVSRRTLRLGSCGLRRYRRTRARLLDYVGEHGGRLWKHGQLPPRVPRPLDQFGPHPDDQERQLIVVPAADGLTGNSRTGAVRVA